jgi:hypothetical protein
MIRQILLYESDTISVYCSPAVSQSSNRALRTYVKAAVAAEKTLIKDIKKKHPQKPVLIPSVTAVNSELIVRVEMLLVKVA